MSKIANLKHNLKWDSKIGDYYRKILIIIGLFFLNTGRKCLKKSLGRCSWCGKDPGMSSTISKKGLRCNTLYRTCIDQ